MSGPEHAPYPELPAAGRPGGRAMSTYVRTKKTFHRPECPALRSPKESAEARVHDWNWPDTQADFDPWIYGAMVVGRADCVQPCRRCFPKGLS